MEGGSRSAGKVSEGTVQQGSLSWFCVLRTISRPGQSVG